MKSETADARPNLSIPDADSTGVSSSIDLLEDIEIQDAEVTLNIDHTYRGDLLVKIIHGDIEEIIAQVEGLDLNKVVVAARELR